MLSKPYMRSTTKNRLLSREVWCCWPQYFVPSKDAYYQKSFRHLDWSVRFQFKRHSLLTSGCQWIYYENSNPQIFSMELNVFKSGLLNADVVKICNRGLESLKQCIHFFYNWQYVLKQYMKLPKISLSR